MLQNLSSAAVVIGALRVKVFCKEFNNNIHEIIKTVNTIFVKCLLPS